MSRTVTLRLDDRDYERFLAAATAEKRTLSNLITTFALRQIEHVALADDFEMEALRNDARLLKRLKSGHGDARKGRGRFVE